MPEDFDAEFVDVIILQKENQSQPELPDSFYDEMEKEGKSIFPVSQNPILGMK